MVEDYLNSAPPSSTATVGSASEYFATLMGAATPADHAAIRDRGSRAAAIGRVELVAELRQRTAQLSRRLSTMDGGLLVGVAGGSVVMQLADYLETRVVEQVVHLDDLARSIEAETWALPEEAMDLVLHVGLAVARHRHGDEDILRGLFRRGHAVGVFPVL